MPKSNKSPDGSIWNREIYFAQVEVSITLRREIDSIRVDNPRKVDLMDQWKKVNSGLHQYEAIVLARLHTQVSELGRE